MCSHCLHSSLMDILPVFLQVVFKRESLSTLITNMVLDLLMLSKNVVFQSALF